MEGRIGASFSRDMEFTGCVDTGFPKHHEEEEVRLRGGAGTHPVAERSVAVTLNEEQRAMLKELTGRAYARVEVYRSGRSRHGELKLTQEQVEAIKRAIGIELSSLTIEVGRLEFSFEKA